MRDFKAVIQELKIYLANGVDAKVLDKDVARVLGISQARFATIKKRNAMPYEALLLYIKRENLSCLKLFFKS